MGILNVTPDSFYDGSRVESENQLIDRAGKMIHEGAAILDVGGYSSRPGAADISVQEELDRVLPAVEQIQKKFPGILISADTFRSEVAEKAIKAGAAIINDISGGNLDEKMFETVAALQVPYILMHMRGTPQNMKEFANYNQITDDVCYELKSQINKAQKAGIKDIILDPGFGFSKTAEQNFRLLSNLEKIVSLGLLVLAGVSRKSMIYKILEITPEESLNGTTALNMYALLKGAAILRVHDVKEAKQVITLYNQTV
ncbi:MAG: dihydropteroate synthase [Crocinitomicaceae bacterium]|nr:dihydropteroate synthase [Crocinitomicaceae bacterium]